MVLFKDTLPASTSRFLAQRRHPGVAFLEGSPAGSWLWGCGGSSGIEGGMERPGLGGTHLSTSLHCCISAEPQVPLWELAGEGSAMGRSEAGAALMLGS